ncbi:hypothetical protein MMC32_007653 [Xylographa parallela]|nr:hypothetical protein [Xylographa parallela]
MSAYKATFPDLSAHDVRQKAQAFEEAAFENASSKEQYHDLWYQSLSRLQLPLKSSVTLSTDTNLKLPINTPSQQIGKYVATYHQSGLFSTIFRAQESNTPSAPLVALKVTIPSQMSLPHNSIREARLLSLATSTNVIPLLSNFHCSGGHFVLVFPFIPYTFGDLLFQHALTQSQIQSHLHDLFSALGHIHSRGILHRDIKPDNILLVSPSGPAYLADFGIAWKEGDPNSEAVDKKITDVGTTCYRAPELLFGKTTYDSSVDMWAAGCVVAEAMLDGTRTLFDAGPLGSELGLIQSIFKTKGTPTTESWPEAAQLPDWGKMRFHEYLPRPWIEVMPDTEQTARELVEKLLKMLEWDALVDEQTGTKTLILVIVKMNITQYYGRDERLAKHSESWMPQAMRGLLDHAQKAWGYNNISGRVKMARKVFDRPSATSTSGVPLGSLPLRREHVNRNIFSR